MQIGGPIIISMKTIIFILAISAIAAPIYTLTCTATIVGCSGCTTGGTICNQASAGYFLGGTAPNLVPTICAYGMGKAADSAPANDAAGTATTSAAACTTTSTGNCNVNSGTAANCVNCKAGHYLSAANTCTLCPAGKGKLIDTAIPTVSTTTGATECAVTSTGGCNHNNGAAGGAGCLSCKAGYYLSAAGVCSWCPAGKGKAIDTTVATVSTTTGATECAVTCTATNCQACGAEADKATCLACAAGRSLSTATPPVCDICKADTYYTATNTCTPCPTGKTRAAPTTAATAVEMESVCTAAAASGSSATLIQALCGASVAAYALF